MGSNEAIPDIQSRHTSRGLLRRLTPRNDVDKKNSGATPPFFVFEEELSRKYES